MPRTEFEVGILDKISDPKDREFVLSIYSLDENGTRYSRLSVTGWDRFKLERIVGKTGYEPSRYRFVGFQNYLDMFDSKKDTTFTPKFYTRQLFRVSTGLPEVISAKDFTRNLLNHIDDPAQREIVENSYQRIGTDYLLNEDLNEYALIDLLLEEPGLDEDEMYDLIDELEIAGTKTRVIDIEDLLASLTGIEDLTDLERNGLRLRVETLLNIYELKGILASNMYETKFAMGVIGFTVFFAFFNVLGANLLALLLALALDTKIRSRNVLRSIFFLPNVLSLVIVASIWRFIFIRVLPYVTGIQVWLSDPNLAPWLLVIL